MIQNYPISKICFVNQIQLLIKTKKSLNIAQLVFGSFLLNFYYPACQNILKLVIKNILFVCNKKKFPIKNNLSSYFFSQVPI